jgi:hypothetical protein
MRWLEVACRLPGRAWQAATALYFESATGGIRNTDTVTLSARARRRFGLDNRTTLRKALKALERAGLVRVEGRPGARSRITILDVPRGETP